jgi:hypothetical protein
MHPTNALALALALGALVAGEAGAQVPGEAPRGSALLGAVADCRSVPGSAERLACYDRAAGQLDTAARTGEVIIVDREQARAARSQSFGLFLPSLSIFNRGCRRRNSPGSASC